MRRNHQVVAVNRQIPHRSVRQVQLQRLPVVAIIERHINGCLRSREQQPFPQRIFSHYVDRSVIGQPRIDFLPGLAKIPGAINMRLQIIQTKTIHRRVYRPGFCP